MAITMPTPWQRLTRSRSTTIASTTVAAGYSEIKMLANESSHVCSASSMVTLAQLPTRHSQVFAHRAHDEHHRSGGHPGEHQRPELALVWRLMKENQVQPHR